MNQAKALKARVLSKYDITKFPDNIKLDVRKAVSNLAKEDKPEVLQVLKSIVDVAMELNSLNRPKSEMHVSTSFVHAAIKDIFKVDSDHSAHW
ncbi:hypothetical protein BD560DRAFT_438564 [Blakeslea trispora]|nr:hypothetical protein BD560DRAFT_438564 [Blakeslea trispora]